MLKVVRESEEEEGREKREKVKQGNVVPEFIYACVKMYFGRKLY